MAASTCDDCALLHAAADERLNWSRMPFTLSMWTDSGRLIIILCGILFVLCPCMIIFGESSFRM